MANEGCRNPKDSAPQGSHGGPEQRISLQQLFRNKSAVQREANLKPARRAEDRASLYSKNRPMWEEGPQSQPGMAAPSPLPRALPRGLLAHKHGQASHGHLLSVIVQPQGEGPERGRGTEGQLHVCPLVHDKGERGEGTAVSRQGVSEPGLQPCARGFRLLLTGGPQVLCLENPHPPDGPAAPAPGISLH